MTDSGAPVGDKAATILRKGRKAARMGTNQWVLLCRAYLWVTVAFVGLRLRGFMPMQRALLGGLSAPSRAYESDRLLQISSAVDMAARNHPLPITCLPRSMALLRLTRACGYAAEIRFGVDKDGGGSVQAHAWVEVEGEVVGDREDIGDDFARLEG